MAMRIALFHNAGGGGSKRAIHQLAQGLICRGHRIDAFVMDTADERFLPLASLDVTPQMFAAPRPPALLSLRPYLLERGLELGRLLHYLDRYRRASRRIAGAIDRGRYDVAWVDKCQISAAPPLLQYLKTRTLYFCHEPLRLIDECQPGDGASIGGWYARLCEQATPLFLRCLHAMDRRSARMAGRIVTNSRYTQQYIHRRYNCQASVSYLGVDTRIFRPSAQPRERIVLSVGRLSPWKRHELAIQAIGRIPAAARPRFVLVAGKLIEGYARSLRAMAAQLDVSMEIRVGLTDSELTQWYNRAAVVLYVAMNEPFGLVAIEAMACGVPVIGVREGGLQETIQHERTGLLVDAEPAACARAIQRILEDSALRAAMGAAGIDAVHSSWTAEAAVARFLGHLQVAAGSTATATGDPVAMELPR
jgi:glycosyltransferase involved in cell wall biosynthesis